MGTEDTMSSDFQQAMGDQFSAVVSPPVAFEDASPHECCEAKFLVIGGSNYLKQE